MSELRRYLSYFAVDTPKLLVAAGLLSLSALIPGATVLLLERAIDGALLEARSSLLLPLCLAFAGLYLLRGVLLVARTRLTKGLAWTLTAALRRDLLGHYLLLPDDRQELVGERIAALTHEVDELQYGVSALVTAIRNPLTLLGLLGTAVVLAPGLAAWAALLVVPVVLAGAWGGRRLRARGRAQRARRAALIGRVGELLGAVDLIQQSGAAEQEVRSFAAINDADRLARLRMEVDRVLPSAITQAIAALGAAVLLFVGGQQVLEGRLQPGELIGFVVALGLMARPLGGLTEVWSLLQRSLAALERVHATLDLPVVADPASPLALPDGPLVLQFEDVWARWGERWVLQGVSLTVRPGETVALVGASGVGKSTLLAVARGRLRPERGRVAVSGVDLWRLTAADRRRAVAVVAQRDVLLARTIGENVSLGRPAATAAEVLEALERAGCDFIQDLPLGVETPTGEQGDWLSGGQRQRICLARALLGAPQILLLDEATNQVDAVAEQTIVGDLRRAAPDRAVLMVAHDPATVARADRVAQLDEAGRLVAAPDTLPRVSA